MSKISYLGTILGVLAVAAALGWSFRTRSNRQSSLPAGYNRAEWKTKYARPETIPFPDDNQLTNQRELLGRTLFFDPRLSGSQTTSCATCHVPARSWGDGLAKGRGQGGQPSARRTPTILNAAWSELLFWDGRAESLEEQALAPIAAPREMNQPLDKMIGTVAKIPGYRALFERAYPGEPVTPKTVARAIATFERTVVSGQAPFDEWIAGRESAISEDAKKGFDLFNTKAACQKCHEGWNFTDASFHDIGMPDDDPGRGALLPIEAMQHAFKTPTLRNVDRRAPYMHDGSENTLEDVIELYDLGGRKKRPSLASEIVPLHLSAIEKANLVAFLKTLTSNDKAVEIPAMPR